MSFFFFFSKNKKKERPSRIALSLIFFSGALCLTAEEKCASVCACTFTRVLRYLARTGEVTLDHSRHPIYLISFVKLPFCVFILSPCKPFSLFLFFPVKAAAGSPLTP